MASHGDYQPTITDTLLFLARTFFLPPKDDNALPTPKIPSMNIYLSENHPWVVFNRALASLCTLKSSANNVFGVMLLPSQSKGRAVPKNVEKVRFLCADNWGKPDDALRPYVTACLEKILAASEEAETAEREGREVVQSQVINDLITHVYENSWPKFVARMEKTNNRGRRLHRFLQSLQKMKGYKPPNLPTLINAVSTVLDIIDSNPKQLNSPADCTVIHEACTTVYKEAFENPKMRDWLLNGNFRRVRSPDACPPSRILLKMVKFRNGIENLMRLVHDPKMRRTFQGARATSAANLPKEPLITWVDESVPLVSKHDKFEVDLSYTDMNGIKSAYDSAINSLPDNKQKQMYASTTEVWQCIQRDMEDAESLDYDHRRGVRLDINRSVFSFPAATRNQHCEGKLLHYVIDEGHLGKVFPYIGCSKRCCEPCFTAITAVNKIINSTKGSEDLCFAVADTHRKVYGGFAITPINHSRFTGFVDEFNTLLCLDIGLVVKAGSGKWFGDSDSAPEP